MMDQLGNLALGFSILLAPENLLAALIGVVLGSLVGVLPGLGPVGAMAVLLPVTFSLTPTSAIILLAGIYYGSMYGGSTTSILLNVPGEATSVVTAIDGHQMTKQGRAGAALAVAAVGSLLAGTLSTMGLMLFAPALGSVALNFGPPEYLAIAVFSLLVLSRLSGDPLPLALMLAGIGLALATVGQNVTTGVARFTFGQIQLAKGIELAAVAVGLFGIAEVFSVAEERAGLPSVIPVKLRELLPTREEWKRSWAPMLRGSVLGFPFGLIPGPCAVISTFASYELEKRVAPADRRAQFGKGAIEGVAGPEAANNAAAGGAMIPLLALGIPFAAPTAMLLGGFTIHNITPGPLMISQHPEVFWALIASMYLGNVMLLVLNLPLVGLFTSILRLPKDVLLVLILVISVVGVYSVNNSLFDLGVMVAAGVVGYLLRKFRLNPTLLILPLVIGAILEQSLLQTILLSRGQPSYLLERPIALVLLALALVVVVLPAVLSAVRGTRAPSALSAAGRAGQF